ncbi:glycosyltransferase [Halorussus halobius]|uniref:glycosyltransferase n=1 Tax=Halorussus halobius TaxID=1710537 RepID=UPI001092671F|nr:glycosyltransferase [Halorussus halobius]
MAPSTVSTTENDSSGDFRSDDRSLPSVSVIVPVFNDPDGIRQTLESLVRQTYPTGKHEIVVVDNGSTDDTRSVVREYQREWDHVTLEIEDEIQGSYAARNAGIRASESDICAFVDADMFVDEEWLESVVGRFADTDAEYIGCNVEMTVPADGDTIFARYNRRVGFPVRFDVEQKKFAPTCCLSVRRSVFEDVGTFDAQLLSGGDLEFGNRVYESGRELYYAEDVVQNHPARSSFRSLAKKAVRQGRGVGQLQRRYPERYGRPGIPPRPDAPLAGDSDGESAPVREQVVFLTLTVLFTLLRGAGYYLEVLESVYDQRIVRSGKRSVHE